MMKHSRIKTWTQHGIEHVHHLSTNEPYLQIVAVGLRAIGFTTEIVPDDQTPGLYSLWAERKHKETSHVN